ncbi:uncharacterized protein LOC107030370 [Solanum pennellii]|uniref:Uncharacterized protein LOC107030370 n=1 Tax=Solanum pennellii TaxID=28526 RepID=A0ABM1HL88_SOLPN|nr:uncharacterized protein LOC107030370 [Solanum pennellii]
MTSCQYFISVSISNFSVRFDGTGYGSWRRTILVALSVRNKLDFIKAISNRPPENSPLFRQWQRYNDLVISWLTNSLSKDIARSVEYSELAKDIWGELKERYGKADASYFNRIKQLWDEIASVSSNQLTICTCGGNKKGEDEQKVYQFLMGVNDTYIQVRSNILMMKPIPTVSNVYNILLADEKRRQISCTSQFSSGSASFSAEASTSKPYSGSSKLTISSKKPGHSIDKCYRLHGFPSTFKFTRGSSSKKVFPHAEVDSSSDSQFDQQMSAILDLLKSNTLN